MDIQKLRHRAFVLALLLAAIVVTWLASARPSNLEPPECTGLVPQEWENPSSRRVPVYTVPSGSPDDRARWLEPGEVFVPLARCGAWLKVPTWFDDEPVYVRIEDVEHTARLAPAGAEE